MIPGHPSRTKGGAKTAFRTLAAVLLGSACGQAPAAGGAGPEPVTPQAAQGTQGTDPESAAPVASPRPVQVTPPQPVQNDPNKPEADQPSASPAPDDPQMIAGGQRMYKDYCQRCHGLNMVSAGGAFFDLRTFPTDQKSRFVNSVIHGKRAMPAWGGVLKQDEIDSLWAYVSSRAGKR